MDKNAEYTHFRKWLETEAHRHEFAPVESDALQWEIYSRALAGDQSFGEHALKRLFYKVASNNLSDMDRVALGVFLVRVLNSRQAINVLCGVSGKKGAGQRGLKQINIARDVADLIQSGATAEHAWAEVAEKASLSPSAVKQYWIKWKPTLARMYSSAIAETNPDISAVELNQKLGSPFAGISSDRE